MENINEDLCPNCGAPFFVEYGGLEFGCWNCGYEEPKDKDIKTEEDGSKSPSV